MKGLGREEFAEGTMEPLKGPQALSHPLLRLWVERMIETRIRYKDLGEADNRVSSLWAEPELQQNPRVHMLALGSEQQCLYSLLGHEARRQACRVLQAKHGMMAAIQAQAPRWGMETTLP